jgi:hypothetical protein
MQHITRWVLLSLIVLLLAACSQPNVAPTEAPVSAEPTAAPADAYPGPATDAYPGPTAGSAYPGPEAAPTAPVSTEPLVVPAPSSNQVGVVTGTLLRITPQGEQVPFTNGILYLGPVLADDTGTEVIVAVDKTAAPQTGFNIFGEFAFVDVPPGRYGLMLDVIQGTVLLNDPSGANDGDLVIEVVGGDTINLGELAYPLP